MTSIFVLAPVCWSVKLHLARTAKCDQIQISNLHIFTDLYHNAPKFKQSDIYHIQTALDVYVVGI
jgi:hypothetical protein